MAAGKVTRAALRIIPATESDIPEILGLIRGLAEYENLQHQMTATEEGLREAIFGSQPAADWLFGNPSAQDLPSSFLHIAAC